MNYGEILLLLLLAGIPAVLSKINSNAFAFPNGQLDGINQRIINGKPAAINQFPYQVGIYAKLATQTTFCGGSLISPSYVLTAAHCVQNVLTLEIILGAHDVTQIEPSQIRYTVTNYTYHPGWDSDRLVNDVAVIPLPEPVALSDAIQTIAIASGNASYQGDVGVVSGWGKTSDGTGSVAPTLMYENVTILSNDACASINPFASVIQSVHLCTSGEGIKGTCSGDSGGPLVDASGEQVGVVSFGYKTCEAGKPTVYARLTEFHEWIKENTDVGY